MQNQACELIHVVQHLRPGGIESLVLELQRIHPHPRRVHIVALEGTRREALAHWPRLRGIKHLHFLQKKPGLQLACLWQLARLIRILRPRAVHSHHIGPLAYTSCARLLSPRCIHVHTEHDAWHLAQAASARLQRRLIKIFRPYWVADAPAVKESCEALKMETAIDCIHNGIDPETFTPGDQQQARAKLELPREATLIGCAARLEEVKGHRFLLEALQQLPKNVHLALCGEGSLSAKIRQQAIDLGLSSRLHLLGQLDNTVDFYRSLDLFCLPSLHEGMPLSPLEAQACGISCVLTNTGSSADCLCPDTGELVPPGDSVKLGAALNNALALAGDERPKLGLRVRDFVEKNANLHHCAEAYRRIYCAGLNSPHTPLSQRSQISQGV